MGEIQGFQIKNNHTVQTISINQCAYIEAIVEKFKLINSKCGATLLGKPKTLAFSLRIFLLFGKWCHVREL
jgi:hypothetical protein